MRRDELKSRSGLFADLRVREFWPVVLFMGLWVAFSYQRGLDERTTGIGTAASALLGMGLILAVGSGGQRQRQQQLRQWIRDRHVPDSVPEHIWRPTLEQYLDSLPAAWVAVGIALLQLAGVFISSNPVGSAAWWNHVPPVIIITGVAAWLLVRFFRDRPIVRSLIAATSAQFWCNYHRDANEEPPPHGS
ncbi:hypothetical protein [Curtobacterium sp. VKM Ac-1393]|uniref:hypothetical protein n=1 Tax=Curtobacterium sp. VKM Ac-1393 TaxID=2783814 RepID=UPI00188B4461|nr:hypothetical protein [Curtobacterium sp. VKM Ac-1393]MBF4608928.1 hypothetical protein [Curtobacterium sp. VKM Ac-1393]